MPVAVAAVAAGVAAGVSTGIAVVGVMTAVAVYAMTTAMTPKLSGLGSSTEDSQSLITSAVSPRRGIYGETIVGGTIFAYGKLLVGDLSYHVMGITIAGHECESVSMYQINDKDYNETSPTYQLFDGTQTAASSKLLQVVDGWDENHIGFGVSYAVIQVKADPETLPSGLKSATFKVRGRKVYDPRRDSTNGGSGAQRADDPTTWEWSDNPILCALDYIRHFGYKPVPISRFIISNIIEQANICDELVDYDDNGTIRQAKRYTCNGFWDFDESPNEVLDKLLSSCAGHIYRVSGRVMIKAGAFSGAPALTLTSNDLIGQVNYQPFTPIRQRCNAVRASYVDKNSQYTTVEAPIISNQAYVDADGCYLEKELELSFTNDVVIAQRLQKVYMERSRAGFSISMDVGPKGMLAMCGQPIAIQIPEDGININCVVTNWSYNKADESVHLEAEIDYPEIWNDDIHATVTRPTIVIPDNMTAGTLAGFTFSETASDELRNGFLTISSAEPSKYTAYEVQIASADGLTRLDKAYTSTSPQINVDGLGIGTYGAYIRARAINGRWTPEVFATFEITVAKTYGTTITDNGDGTYSITVRNEQGEQIPARVYDFSATGWITNEKLDNGLKSRIDLIDKPVTGVLVRLQNIEADYVTGSQMGAYVTTQQLEAKDFATREEMTSYVTATSLNTTLQTFVTQSALVSADYAKNSELTAYVKTSDLNITLESYVTSTQLANADYATSTDLIAYAKADRVSAVEQRMSAVENEAYYSLKVQANGKVAGFGATASPSGTSIKFTADQLGFDDGSADGIMPFSIVNGIVWMNKARVSTIEAGTIVNVEDVNDPNSRTARLGHTVIEGDFTLAKAGQIKWGDLSPEFRDRLVQTDPDATVTGGTRTKSQNPVVAGTYYAASVNGSPETGDEVISSGGASTQVRLKINGGIPIQYGYMGNAAAPSCRVQIYRKAVGGTSELINDTTYTGTSHNLHAGGEPDEHYSDIRIDTVIQCPLPSGGSDYEYWFTVSNVSGSWAPANFYQSTSGGTISLTVTETIGSSGGVLVESLANSGTKVLTVSDSQNRGATVVSGGLYVANYAKQIADSSGQLYDNGQRVYSPNNRNIGTGSTNYAAGNHSHSYLPLAGGTLTGNLFVKTPYQAAAVTDLTLSAGAPIVAVGGSIGTTPAFMALTHQYATYSSGYRTNLYTGLYKAPSSWGVGDTGFFVAMGGNDNYATEYFKMMMGGDISHSSGKTFIHSSNYNNYVPTKTGGGASGTWGISITGNAATATTTTGNAATATTLQTARTINGTSFNGGSNITTSYWGTGRTLTIGGTGKSVNGSANVSWSLTEIGVPSLTGAGASGNWNIASKTLYSNASWQTIDLNFYTAAGDISYEHFSSSSTNRPPVVHNANAVLTAGTHSGNYTHQLAFSSDGNLYQRRAEAGTYQSWRTILDSSNYNSFSPTNTGGGATGTWNIGISGNAATATTLQTARTINGSSFNGGGNITTSYWGSGRTITIGRGGKTVNGSANYSWSLEDIFGSYVDASFYYNGNTTETHLVAVMPASTAATYDTFTIEGVWGAWTATRTHFKITATNREGLKVTGYSSEGNCPVLFYTQTDGTVKVYVQLTAYQVIQYRIYARQMNNVYQVGEAPQAVTGTRAWGTTDIPRPLATNNFNGYAPTLTGGGASGTWGINISGNASYASVREHTTNDVEYPVVWENMSGNTLYKSTNHMMYNPANRRLTLAGSVTAPTFNGALNGNANTATRLQTARSINNVNFDGTANISIVELVSKGALSAPATGTRNTNGNGVFTYNVHNASLGDSTPTSYWSVLGFGRGGAGMAEIAASWTGSGVELYFRSLRDVTDNWWAWKEILHSSNYTAYAVGINTSSTISGNNTLTFGPNGSWGKYLRIGGNGYSGDANTAGVTTTNGNLHLDAAAGSFAAYFNWYAGTNGVYFGNGAQGQIGRIDGGGNASFSGTISGLRFYTGYDSGVTNSFSCSNWFRSSGSTGWFNATYGGGIYMADSTWVRTYGTKKFYVDNTAYDAIYTAGGVNASTYTIASNGGVIGATGASHSTINVSGYAKGGYYGLALNNDAQFMSSGSAMGLYWGSVTKWGLYSSKNGSTLIHYNGATRITTTSAGADVTGTLRATSWGTGGANAKVMTWDDFLPDTPPAGLEDVITANWIAAGAINAKHLQVNSITETNGIRTSFKIAPDANRPLHLAKIDANNNVTEDIFYVDTEGNGFFNGKLSKDTVDIDSIQEEARRQINPYYIGTTSGNQQSAATTTLSSGGTLALAAISTLAGKVNLSLSMTASAYVMSPTFPAYSVPIWKLEVFRGTTAGTKLLDKTYTGTANNWYDGELGLYDASAVLTINEQLTDTSAASSQVYTIRVTRVSGTPTTMRVTRFEGQSPAFKEIRSQLEYTQLYYNAAGLGSGNITLADDYNKYEFLVVAGADDGDDQLVTNVIPTYAVQMDITNVDNQRFFLFSNDSRYWTVSLSGLRTLVLGSENGVVHRVWGVNIKEKVS
ncbi:hypothetical protein JYB87_11800 [Shewanella avicenniae]|uniref:Tip attachment protein J domain-containing protein n=1 Tax=Shewanella avicenniae TaxID=2814294 RepID=A0ABX7QNX7_9GAMM|nr:hypothetical protein [Shewanella avicenniae]QSX32450.1 hypothetical protein JYB87_11800 [Shewanella avicenniae]